ncbi:MAG: Mannose-phosphate guanylyltransferase [Acidimicrobiales bacterium]|nr:Mannose-phosphate guanylyltransferase [Acidimicrobiales bacterium]
MLVGGFGTRLRPLTLTKPKQMLPVAGRPMIEDVLGHLRHHGVDEVVLSLGYRPDAFLDAYPDATSAGVRLIYAVEPEPLDTAGAIAFAAREAGIDERFLVVNGDVLTDLDISALVAFHDAAGAEGTIALTRVEDPSHFGVVPTEADGRVIAFVEKPPRDEAPTDLINAGYYVLEPSVLDRIPAGRKVNIERETFPAMVADGRLFARPDAAYWLDVGTPERLLQASLDLLTGVRSGGPDGDVLLMGDASIDEGARVARSVLGDGCRVGPGAVVEDAVLLPGVVVEKDATVRRSVVGTDAVVSAGSTVTDLSVLGDCVRTEPGDTLSGVRVPDPDSPS